MRCKSKNRLRKLNGSGSNLCLFRLLNVSIILYVRNYMIMKLQNMLIKIIVVRVILQHVECDQEVGLEQL